MSETQHSEATLLAEIDSAWKAGRRQDAFGRLVAFIKAYPVLEGAPRPGQRLNILVLNPFPSLPFRDLEDLHHSGNFPSQIARVLAEQFCFHSVFAEVGHAPTAMRTLPRPDLVLNNVTNGEVLSMPQMLDRVGATADASGAPVINHPARAAAATRQRNAARLADIPGVRAPKVGRFWNDPLQQDALVARIEEVFGLPVIIRSVFEQMGQLTWRADSRAQIREALAALKGEAQIYGIAYRPSPHPDGLFRVMRAAFVDGQPIIIRCDFGTSWNVRARREESTRAVYRDNPALLARANAIIVDPAAHLPARALEALVRAGSVIPLDMFGMDFDVTPDGELIVFEANATMNLLSNVADNLEYPREPEQALVAAIAHSFAARAGLPG